MRVRSLRTGEVVGGGKPGQRAANDGQELGAEHVTDAGPAGDDRGVIVGPKVANQFTIKAGELAGEVELGLGESHNKGSGGCLAGHLSGFAADGFDELIECVRADVPFGAAVFLAACV